jgi:hypothetical protein
VGRGAGFGDEAAFAVRGREGKAYHSVQSLLRRATLARPCINITYNASTQAVCAWARRSWPRSSPQAGPAAGPAAGQSLAIPMGPIGAGGVVAGGGGVRIFTDPPHKWDTKKQSLPPANIDTNSAKHVNRQLCT